MLRKQLEIQPEVAQAFVRDMKKFFKAPPGIDRDEVAAGTAWMLKNHLPRGTKLRITDVKELFSRDEGPIIKITEAQFMSDSAYRQFRVEKIEEIELHIDDERRDDTVLRLFAISRRGDQIALEIPHAMWTEIFEVLSAGLKQFPDGGQRH